MKQTREQRVMDTTSNSFVGSLGLDRQGTHNFQEHTKDGCGILGFVKFLKGYYLILITAKKKVAKIGFHDIYTIKDIKMIRLFRWTNSHKKEDENKYVDLFK
jgi:hypothetical protein